MVFLQGRPLHAVRHSVLRAAVVHAAGLHVSGPQRALVPGGGVHVRDPHECTRVTSSPSHLSIHILAITHPHVAQFSSQPTHTI